MPGEVKHFALPGLNSSGSPQLCHPAQYHPVTPEPPSLCFLCFWKGPLPMTGETAGPSQRAPWQSLLLFLCGAEEGDLKTPLETGSPRWCLLTGLLPSPPKEAPHSCNHTLATSPPGPHWLRPKLENEKGNGSVGISQRRIVLNCCFPISVVLCTSKPFMRSSFCRVTALPYCLLDKFLFIPSNPIQMSPSLGCLAYLPSGHSPTSWVCLCFAPTLTISHSH